MNGAKSSSSTARAAVLRKGMTKRQVEAVLGPVDDDEPTRNGEWCIYVQAGGVGRFADFFTADVHFTRGRVTRWVGDVQGVAGLVAASKALVRGRAIAKRRG